MTICVDIYVTNDSVAKFEAENHAEKEGPQLLRGWWWHCRRSHTCPAAFPDRRSAPIHGSGGQCQRSKKRNFWRKHRRVQVLRLVNAWVCAGRMGITTRTGCHIKHKNQLRHKGCIRRDTRNITNVSILPTPHRSPSGEVRPPQFG